METKPLLLSKGSVCYACVECHDIEKGIYGYLFNETINQRHVFASFGIEPEIKGFEFRARDILYTGTDPEVGRKEFKKYLKSKGIDVSGATVMDEKTSTNLMTSIASVFHCDYEEGQNYVFDGNFSHKVRKDDANIIVEVRNETVHRVKIINTELYAVNIPDKFSPIQSDSAGVMTYNKQILKPSKLAAISLRYGRVYADKKGEAWGGSIDDFIKSSPKEIHTAFDLTKQRAMEVVAEEMKPFTLEVSVSDKVETIYSMPTYERNTGTLGNSCMRSERKDDYACANSSGFYDLLPDVKIVYVSKGDKLVARALMWDNITNKTTGQTFSYIDRIYGSEKSISFIKGWAKDNGLWFKDRQTYDDVLLIDGHGNKVSEFYTQEFTLTKSRSMSKQPYLDTLSNVIQTSESKNFVRFRMSSFDDGSFEDMKDKRSFRGTDAPPVAHVCKNCGKIHIGGKTEAKDEQGTYKYACHLCSFNYGGSYFIKSDSDVELTHSSDPLRKRIPSAHKEEVLSFKANGRDYAVSTRDHSWFVNFMKSFQGNNLKF